MRQALVEKVSKFKDALKTFDDFKNKQKSVWSNDFWYVKVCIFWNCIQYTMHWDKTQMLKKIYSDKNKRYKKSLFFLSWAPSHHNFTFFLRFLYELQQRVRLSKTVCGNFYFRFRLVFIKLYIFVQQKGWIFKKLWRTSKGLKNLWTKEPPKRILLASMIALQKGWKILFVSS